MGCVRIVRSAGRIRILRFLRRGRRVTVGNDKACGSISGDGSFVTFYLGFLNGIDDFLSALEFIQSGKGMRPLVTVAEDSRLFSILSISQ